MIEFESVTKTYAGRIVVDRLTLHIPAGQSTVLIGPSGCGKSTTLRMINRLIAPERGVVRVSGQDVASADPQTLRRGIGYAIQAGGLFPHWTVARNIATVPRLLGWPRARIGARVAELLVLLGLPAGQFADKFPAELSGGQQQRVGVARALAAEPKLLLLDEPFGALDPITRFGLQRALRDIQRTNRQTMVFVTHDMDEALLLADRIVILDAGRVVGDGTPAELLDRPPNDFVRHFVAGEAGLMRRLAVRRVADILRPGEASDAPVFDAPAIDARASLREALGQMVAARTKHLRVQDGQGAPIGHIRLEDIVA